MCIYMHIYYIYTCVHIYIYIYTYVYYMAYIAEVFGNIDSGPIFWYRLQPRLMQTPAFVFPERKSHQSQMDSKIAPPSTLRH